MHNLSYKFFLMVYNKSIKGQFIFYFISMKKQSVLIILAVVIIVLGVAVYVSMKKGSVAPLTVSESIEQGTGVAVSPYDFNASGCVGDAGDMAKLKEMCSASGGCDVLGETDPIQAALKFADAQKMYQCK